MNEENMQYAARYHETPVELALTKKSELLGFGRIKSRLLWTDKGDDIRIVKDDGTDQILLKTNIDEITDSEISLNTAVIKVGGKRYFMLARVKLIEKITPEVGGFNATPDSLGLAAISMGSAQFSKDLKSFEELLSSHATSNFKKSHPLRAVYIGLAIGVSLVLIVIAGIALLLLTGAGKN